MVGLALAMAVAWLVVNPESYEAVFVPTENAGAEYGEDEVGQESENSGLLAKDVLEKLEVKGRAPKTGYNREQFYDGWPVVDGCSLRQRIIKREFGDSAVLDGCNVVAGEYEEPYQEYCR